ncbi:MAG: DUF4837 family protein, partial [Bacteroidales bacterium]|nr:DUF4837 family protein [Bacteroidales bacterium]
KINIFGYFIISILLLSITSCDRESQLGKKDRSAGGTSEILVVTQNDEQWNGMIGDTIRAFFLQPQYGLPQPEPLNKLSHINVKGFTDLFKKHKCLLLVEINPNLDKPVVETGEDLWAAPQRVMKIVAPDRTSWCKVFNEQKEAYKVMYDKVERERIMSVLRPSNDVKITQRIKEKMGFDITIPSGFFISKDEPDFMWIRKELDKNSFGLFIYTTPYKDTLQLEMSSLVTVRDRMTQKYVPGPADGSFMTTDKEFVPPVVSYISTFPTGFAAEMRGMWCLVGDYMAGPFVSYTFPDNKTGNLVTVEGYVYYPNHDKRDDLLQLQAILYSIRMPEE